MFILKKIEWCEFKWKYGKLSERSFMDFYIFFWLEFYWQWFDKHTQKKRIHNFKLDLTVSTRFYLNFIILTELNLSCDFWCVAVLYYIRKTAIFILQNMLDNTITKSDYMWPCDLTFLIIFQPNYVQKLRKN